jgi:hypothetical protein
MQVAQQLDPLSLVIGVELGEFLEMVGRQAEATAQYERVITQYPDAFLTRYYAGPHFLGRGNFERAAPLLARLSMDYGQDAEGAERVLRGILDPSLRRKTLEDLSAASRFPDIEIAAWKAEGNDSAAIAVFERAVDGALFERIYLGQTLSLLGPQLSAHPRTKTAIQRYILRLRRERSS